MGACPASVRLAQAREGLPAGATRAFVRLSQQGAFRSAQSSLALSPKGRSSTAGSRPHQALRPCENNNKVWTKTEDEATLGEAHATFMIVESSAHGMG